MVTPAVADTENEALIVADAELASPAGDAPDAEPAPAAAPSTAVEAAPPAPVAPAVPDAVTQRIAALEAQLAASQRAEAQRAEQDDVRNATALWNQRVEQEVTALQRRLEAQGLGQAEIDLQVQERRQSRDAELRTAYQNWQAQKQAASQQNNIVQRVAAHQTAALNIAEKHGLTVAEMKQLLPHPTTQAMELQAQLIALNKTHAAAKRQTPTPQSFDNGQAAGGRLNYAEVLRSGKPLPPSEEIDRETAKYLRG